MFRESYHYGTNLFGNGLRKLFISEALKGNEILVCFFSDRGFP